MRTPHSNRIGTKAGWSRLTETAVLKSAGLESLLKSKNSIGDLNPFKRVSYKQKTNTKPSAKNVVQNHKKKEGDFDV